MYLQTARIERRDDAYAISHLHLVSDMNTCDLTRPKVTRARAQKEARRRQKGHDQLLLAALALMMALLVSSWACDKARTQTVSALLDVVPTTQHTVSAGETLWSIASTHPVKGVPTKEVVRWLGEENGLDSSVLALGQTLVVPSQEPDLDTSA